MKPFRILEAVAAPLPLVNIDTDMIIPKQYLRTIKRTGLGAHLFAEMRYNADGSENPAFILNQTPYRQAGILIAGENFGCGSSREHAPWALLDFGITCVIAPSFADIFHGNCFKNGMCPVTLKQAEVQALLDHIAVHPEGRITVDLEARQVRAGDHAFDFAIDPFRRHCLLNGLDDIGLTLEHEADIAAYEDQRRKERPWL